MAAVTSASFWLTLLSVVLFVSGEQTNITAGSGQTVSLPCKALNNDPVIAVEWRKTDLKEDEYVLLYRNDQFDPDNQLPSYKNRVDLQDRQMKDGNVSLILKNVTTNDTGTYECYVVQSKTNDMTITVRLDVVLPDHKEDRGDKAGGDKEGGDKVGGDEEGSIGLIIGSVVLILVTAAVVVGFLIFRRHKHELSPGPYHPPDPNPDAKHL